MLIIMAGLVGSSVPCPAKYIGVYNQPAPDTFLILISRCIVWVYLERSRRPEDALAGPLGRPNHGLPRSCGRCAEKVGGGHRARQVAARGLQELRTLHRLPPEAPSNRVRQRDRICGPRIHL